MNFSTVKLDMIMSTMPIILVMYRSCVLFTSEIIPFCYSIAILMVPYLARITFLDYVTCRSNVPPALAPSIQLGKGGDSALLAEKI